MLGHGDIDFLDDKLDFNVRLNMKGPGVLLHRCINFWNTPAQEA